MIRKNYYLVLGVPLQETAQGIQAAYRDLAKRYHPDRAGPDATSRFQDIPASCRIRRRDGAITTNFKSTTRQDAPRPSPFILVHARGPSR
jgi:hypothetical protein